MSNFICKLYSTIKNNDELDHILKMIKFQYNYMNIDDSEFEYMTHNRIYSSTNIDQQKEKVKIWNKIFINKKRSFIYIITTI